MIRGDTAAPLLPVGTTPTPAESESSFPTDDIDPPIVIARAPARHVGELGTHLAKRLILAGRVRSMTRRRRLDRVSLPLPGGAGHRQGIAAGLRTTALGGAMHVIVPADAKSILDVVLAEAAATAVGSIRVGSGGGMRIRCKVSGHPAILRLGKAETPADPTRHYRALQAAGDLPQVPALLAHGRVENVVWAAEERIAGRTTRRIDPERMVQLDRFLLSLPRADRIVVPFDRVSGLARIAGPGGAEVTAASERARQVLAGRTGTMSHGDFWLGNTLYRGGNLVAVIDWDGWAPEGAPGTDLLHFFADRNRRKDRSSYGAQIVRRFWRAPEIRTQLDTHLAACDFPSDNRTVDALGIAWWLGAVTNAVERNPQLADNIGWMQRNVHKPAAALAEEPS